MNGTSYVNLKLRLLFWESTIKCNLSCAHCRRIDGDAAADTDLTTAQACQLIEQLALLGEQQEFMPILVFSGGEPLCRPDLFALVDYAAARRLKCALATNGTLIDTAIAEKIKAAAIQRVSVSLDGAAGRVHNKLRRQEGSFEAALYGIECLRQQGIPFQINMTMTRYNVHQLDELFALAETLQAAAVHLFMLVPVGCGQEFVQEDMLSADEYERMLERIAAKQIDSCLEIKVTCGPHFERIVRRANQPGWPMSKGCLAGSGVLFVSHDGRVFPCGYLPIDCGNIKQMPLADIWNNNTDLARMRDPQQLKGKCGVCGYRTVCGGCRARAFAATGDYMQAEPMCTYEPPTKHHNAAQDCHD